MNADPSTLFRRTIDLVAARVTATQDLMSRAKPVVLARCGGIGLVRSPGLLLGHGRVGAAVTGKDHRLPHRSL